ncbi:MAG: hypothetical protein WC521_01440 [Bdellovibrionales bacterium]
MPNIAIVWDFDGTLTPEDSTIKTVDVLEGRDGGGRAFFDNVKKLKGDKKQPKWEHVLAMDAPIWMYSLSKLAREKNVPLNEQFFQHFVLPQISLFPNVVEFLHKIKALEKTKPFKNVNLKIHHFIITAGLKDLVEQVFPRGLIRMTFGCRYTVVIDPLNPDAPPESVPVFCMDETVKTRSLFEISKGSFRNKKIKVNTRIRNDKYWAPFSDMIYIGDGDTDVPSLSLVRSKGGMGVAVYNSQKSATEIQNRLHNMSLDKRADFITPADFSFDGALLKFIESRCIQIRQRCEAAKFNLEQTA